MRKLAKSGRLLISFRALGAGKFAVVFRGAATKAGAARSIVIANAARSVSSAGRVKVTLKLTKAGKRLLRRTARRAKGKLTASFTKPAGGKLSRSKSVTLKRR